MVKLKLRGWEFPRAFLTTRIRLTAIVVHGVSVPAGWKEISSARASHDGSVFR
jgi:hypothetical protein